MKSRIIHSLIGITLLSLILSGCTSTKRPVAVSPPCSANPCANENPKSLPLSRYGNPDCYDIEGQRYYVLKSAKGYCKQGVASWYGTKFHGRNTSSREPYNMFAMTAASTSLPIPTYVEVTNLENGKKIIVRVNDRGPFKSNRLIDLSYGAASKLGFANKGTANVQVRALDPKDLNEAGMPQGEMLANQEDYPEIQINPIALPAPTQLSKPITVERYLQLGAFSNRDNAARLQREIAASTSANILLREGKTETGSIYRVQIGPFKSCDEANKVSEALKGKGIEVITVFSE